jgi:sugar diacid utilization regulator
MQNYTPIDIAGISGYPKIVRAFTEFLIKKMPTHGKVNVTPNAE